ncbi:tRNA delta(2)-isopentenylpyrophosphate transferase [Verrucomicrobiia bacterium DG1235]|nr:tRNA delta(2)-isopentenylpyrophosphate transferase [Verrucomicrobiae bacterium DG1235]
MERNRQEESDNGGSLGPIYCLSGCTAVGKTEIALGWAERHGAEIVNCDSLLFYRAMDIGTAKPSVREQARGRHHLIDFIEPSERMDVGRFVGLAIDAIREIQARGRKVLVTGGSGFYLKAFFSPVVDGVVVSEASAREADVFMEKGLDAAVSELRRRNPDGLEGLDAENPRRVAKALERCIESGMTLCELKVAFERQTNALIEAPKFLCILERDKEELNARIAQRVSLMLEAGLVEEVRGLLGRGIESNPSACNAIGYRETIAHLRGAFDLAALSEKIATNTRRLAKKQRTWFRTQLPVGGKRLDLTDGRVPELDEIFEEIA